LGKSAIFGQSHYILEKVQDRRIWFLWNVTATLTRSSADADNRRDAFSGQLRSTNMVPFWVRCDFSLSMWPAPRVTGTHDFLLTFHSPSSYLAPFPRCLSFPSKIVIFSHPSI